MKLYQKEPNHVFYTYDEMFCSESKKQISDGYEINIKGELFIVDCKNFISVMEKTFNTDQSLKYIEIRYIKSSALPTKKTRKIERNKMTLTLRYSILRKDGFKCVTCGLTASQINLEIDHIVPVSKGGKTIKENLQTLCVLCNKGKGASHG